MAATIAKSRMLVAGTRFGYGAPPQVLVPVSGDALSESEIPGAVWARDNTNISTTFETAADDATAVAGILEVSTAATLASSEINVPLTVFLPYCFYEGSTDATVASTAAASMAVITAAGSYSLLDVTGASNLIFRIIGFASDVEKFVLGGYYNKSGTIATGATIYGGNAGAKGVVGDDYPRMIFRPLDSACQL